MPITDSSNLTKYHRPLTFTHDGKAITVYLDCYDILALSKRRTDGTLRPARPSDDALAHAVKKLLFPGQRGSKGVVTDLVEAVAAIKRAIELEVGECEESASHPN